MPDNVTLPGTGQIVATKLIGGVQYQWTIPSDSAGAEILLNALLGATNETAPVTDTAAAGHSGRLQRIAQNITSLIALLPTARSANGGLKVGMVGDGEPTWTVIHAPAANTKATITQAAAGVGIKNICRSITFSICSDGAPTPTKLTVSVIDGASGGTAIWSAVVSLTAVAGDRAGATINNIWVPGSTNTQMTLEFSAAGGANTYEAVSMGGTTQA